MDLFNLIAKITLNDKDYKKGISSAEKSGKSFGATLTSGLKTAGKAMAALYTGTVAVAAAIAKITLKAVDYGDTISEESQKLNMSTKGYQLWSTMLKTAGSSIDSMSQGMKTFTGILDDASTGNSDALLTLKKLGLGYEDFAGLSVDDSLKKVTEQFQKMQQGADKTQLAIDIFGRTGQELLPLLNQEVGSIDTLFKSYEDLGLVVSDEVITSSGNLNDQISLLGDKIKVVGVNIGSIFMPALSLMITGLTDMASGAESGAESLQTGLISVLDTVISYLPKIGDFAAKIVPLIIDTVVSTLPSLVDAAIQIVVTLSEMLIDYLPDLIPAAVGMILTIVTGLLDNLPKLIDVAIDLILAVVYGIINSLPLLIEAAPEIIISIIDGIIYAIPKLLEAATLIISKLVEYLLRPETLVMLINATIQIYGALITGFFNNIGNIVKIVPQLFDTIANAFLNADWESIGRNILYGVKDGILSAVSSAVKAAKSAAQSIFDAVKGFFQIKSPSKLMRDKVGVYIPQGIAVGVENEMPETADRIKKSIKDNTDVDDMVNGFNDVSKIRNYNNSQPIQLTVPVYIGNDKFKTYTYKAVDDGMKQRGLRNLQTTGGYNP